MGKEYNLNVQVSDCTLPLFICVSNYTTVLRFGLDMHGARDPKSMSALDKSIVQKLLILILAYSVQF
jgi:hypothetical protein